jgi:hypothetical protein
MRLAGVLALALAAGAAPAARPHRTIEGQGYRSDRDPRMGGL